MNGLLRKLTEHDFLQFVTQYDLIFLSETWISESACNTVNLDIDGYSCMHIPGNKSKRSSRGRCSGGISVYYKTELKTY